MSRSGDLADVFAAWLPLLAPDQPAPQREYRFDAVRRWRFDLAWPLQLVAVECDGGQWCAGGGRHNGDADREKLNAAAVQGWRVLRFSARQITTDPDGCIATLTQALAGVPTQVCRACHEHPQGSLEAMWRGE